MLYPQDDMFLYYNKMFRKERESRNFWRALQRVLSNRYLPLEKGWQDLDFEFQFALDYVVSQFIELTRKQAEREAIAEYERDHKVTDSEAYQQGFKAGFGKGYTQGFSERKK